MVALEKQVVADKGNTLQWRYLDQIKESLIMSALASEAMHCLN